MVLNATTAIVHMGWLGAVTSIEFKLGGLSEDDIMIKGMRTEERLGHAVGVCVIGFCVLTISISLYHFLVRNPIQQAKCYSYSFSLGVLFDYSSPFPSQDAWDEWFYMGLRMDNRLLGTEI